MNTTAIAQPPSPQPLDADTLHHNLASLLFLKGKDQEEGKYFFLETPATGHISLSNYFNHLNWGNQDPGPDTPSILAIEPIDRKNLGQYFLMRPSDAKGLLQGMLQAANINTTDQNLMLVEIITSPDQSVTSRVITDLSEAPMVQLFNQEYQKLTTTA